MNKRKVLIPIHPEWCEKIFNGEKTIEVRKTAPKIDTPFEALVYCTKGKPYLYKNPNNAELFLDNNGGYRRRGYEDWYLSGKVIGSFVCDKVDFIEYKGSSYMINDDIAYTNTIASKSCLDYDDMYKYLGIKNGRALHITKPKLFDRPMELSEFGTICKKDGNDECGDCLYLQVHVNSYPCDDCVDTWCGVDNIKPITRAPQSWCYVEI